MIFLKEGGLGRSPIHRYKPSLLDSHLGTFFKVSAYNENSAERCCFLSFSSSVLVYDPTGYFVF